MAKFQKGEGGRPKGAQNKETKKLREFLSDVLHNHQQKFEEALLSLDDKDFIKAYTDLLEYSTPKLQRTEHSGEITTSTTAVFKLGGQEIPFDKKG